MSRVVTLDTVAVRENVILPEFEERRRLGLGQFLTRSDLAKIEGRWLSGALRQLRGASMIEARNKAWMLSSRAPAQLSAATVNTNTEKHPQVWCPSKEDKPLIAYGYRCGCYARVYIDRHLMNPERPAEPFDVNSIPPASIEAIEWYSGPAQTPPEYNKLDSACGVLVIHTRRSD